MRTHRLGTNGTAAIEFAMVGFAFVLFLVLAFETALQLAVGAALDRGARLASRAGALGSLSGDTAAQATRVAAVVIGAAPGLLHANNLSVTVQSFPGFAQLDDTTAARAGAGAPAQVARYALRYQQRIFSGAAFVRETLGRDYLEHRAVLLVKNEPAPQS